MEASDVAANDGTRTGGNCVWVGHGGELGDGDCGGAGDFRTDYFPDRDCARDFPAGVSDDGGVGEERRSGIGFGEYLGVQYLQYLRGTRDSGGDFWGGDAGVVPGVRFGDAGGVGDAAILLQFN